MGEMVQAPTVRVLSVSRVAPSQQQHGGRVKLNYLDVLWIRLPAVQQLFLYDLGDRDDGFPTAVSRLKAALADTLTHYLPWAGMLEYEAETGHVVVDCTGDAGVDFVEAEADGMDVRRLAHAESPDMPAFVCLVPELDARVLPAAVLSVQVTRLGACGLAVGLSMHHAVADGRGMWRFMEAWASSSREGSTTAGTLPIYCRDTVHYPRADELARQRLKILAPNLPVVYSGERDLKSPLLRLARWTFHLGAGDIGSLKRRINDLAPAASKPKPVSTFVALAALNWMAFVRSTGLGAGDDTSLVFLADLRARLDPPIPDAYFGNCVRNCVAGCPDAAEIAGECGILHAAREVQALVAEIEAAPLLDYDEELANMVRPLPLLRRTNVVGSPWFKGYEVADFGFGKPALAEVVSMRHDGEMMLLGGRRVGEVQVSVSIDPAHMAMFKAYILDWLPTQSTQLK